MGTLVRTQTRSRFAIFKVLAALASVALAYVALGTIAACVVALPIVGFALRRVVLGRRST